MCYLIHEYCMCKISDNDYLLSVFFSMIHQLYCVSKKLHTPNNVYILVHVYCQKNIENNNKINKFYNL